MARTRGSLPLVLLFALTAALTVTAMVTGCSSTTSTPVTPTGATALEGLEAARSALATTAPDAKLLIVQTPTATETSATVVWAYLFGSPSTDLTYLVYTHDGQAMGASEYGKAGLSADEWAQVPNTTTWAVDSDEAFQKAYEVSGAKSAPKGYRMGLITYKSAQETTTVEPFVWQVRFDPAGSGATSALILVDAETGKAKVDR